MAVTLTTWIVAVLGLLIMGLLFVFQLIAVLRPRAAWTVENIYGGDPEAIDDKGHFAFYQGMAWADVFFWAPLQLAGIVGMLLGARWGFLLCLLSAAPYIYTAITIFIWDRDLGLRKNTFVYWVIVWGMFPAYGALDLGYCLYRLL